jgi:hypothetical protein
VGQGDRTIIRWLKSFWVILSNPKILLVPNLSKRIDDWLLRFIGFNNLGKT